MLQDLFPQCYKRYLSLPILGPTLEGFAAFLFARGYPRGIVRLHLRAAGKIDERLRNRRCTSDSEITRDLLRGCAPTAGRSHEDPSSSAVVHLLEAYLVEQGLLASPLVSGPGEQRLAEYGRYLVQARGLAPSTIAAHLRTASQLFALLNDEDGSGVSHWLTAKDLETFVCRTARGVGRGTLQHTVSHLRSALRFLATRGEAQPGLDSQIDTPRVYRRESLPRSLPWATVRALLASIDCSTPMGKRDYAMFQLIVNYGLRAGEVAGLRLPDIQWRAGSLSVWQRKSATALVFPLTDAVGDSLVAYLRHGRPQSCYREVFLRHRAPAGVLKPTAVTEAFQAWSRRSGLPIPFQGCHCLRHSYAVHLLRQGTSLKTIGDLLGHRSTESTCVYLQLAIEDLRDVALELPADILAEVGA
jgi:site-specific recombinase XerD